MSGSGSEGGSWSRRLVAALLVVTLLLLLRLVVAAFMKPSALEGSGRDPVADREEQLEQLEAHVQKGINLEKRLPRLEREIQYLEEEIDSLDDTLLVANAADARLRLRRLLERVGFEVLRLESEAVADPDHEHLRVEVTAPFELWMEYTQDLMNAPLLVNVQELRMSREPEGERARVGFRAILGRRPGR